MTSIAANCQQTVGFLIRRGLLPNFDATGPWRPHVIQTKPSLTREDMIRLHYGALNGAVYRDEDQWRLCYRVVKSFTKSGAQSATCIFPNAFGDLAIPLRDVFDILATAFSLQNFVMSNPSPGAKLLSFRATDSCKTENLPEPYGKWLQHQKRDARWGKPVELELRLTCKLSSPDAKSCRVQIVASTFALPTLVELNHSLTELLGLPEPLQTKLSYLKTKVTFKLNETLVDLSRLR